MEYINPYLYGMRCISGKWKTTILHHIHTYGRIRFNETKKTLPISEKVLSQQLKELERDGLVRRIQYQVMPLKVEYVLTPIGEELIPALDLIYIWSIRRMHERKVPIDPMPLSFIRTSGISMPLAILWRATVFSRAP